MANAGGGNYYFIESPLGIPDLFVKEFKELAAVTARDVELTLTIPPHVTVEVLGGWKNEMSGGRLRIDLGSLFSGQSQEIYLKLLTPPSDSQEELVFHAKLLGKLQAGEVGEDQAAVSFRYAAAELLAAAPRNREVMLHFALVNLAEVANQAVKLERHGEREQASRLLQQAIEENREYLDPLELERYERMAERMQRGMEEYDRKQSQFTSYNQRRRRG
jgi:Ca-activated chloride channel family protein